MNPARTIAALVLAAPFACMADVDTDRDAGACAGVIMVAGRIEGADRAIAMGDNRRRVMGFAKAWLSDFAKLEPGSKKRTAAMFLAMQACDRVGVQFSDYRK